MENLDTVLYYVDREILREVHATPRESWEDFLLNDYWLLRYDWIKKTLQLLKSFFIYYARHNYFS